MPPEISPLLGRILKGIYRTLDRVYLPLDRGQIQRTRNIQRIPFEPDRRGGKYAYGEWAHVIGIFQTLINLELEKKTGNRILDIGCGTGLLGIACQPFLERGGKYTGIDVMEGDIEFCQSHYPSDQYEFIHLDVSNPFYAPAQRQDQIPWPLESASIDLATALSVWTHFSERDAMFYIAEVGRVLKPDGKAIITFFRLDDSDQDHDHREESSYHAAKEGPWVFDQPAYDSQDWRCPGWAVTPESAVGITDAGFDRLTSHAGLKVEKYYPGNWKEIPGLYFQDIVVFKKPA